MDRKKAIALSFSVPVAWGFSYPLMKIGMDSMNATSIVALRCIIAFAACVLLFHKHAVRINRDVMVRSAIIGAIMATELTCMCLGSSLTSASTAGFLQSLTVVIVPFANAALLRRAPERKVLIGTAIVTCGMLLLSGADFTSLNPGAIIMLLSAFIYAGHIIVAKRFVEEVDPLALGVWQLGFGGLFSGIAACTFGGFTLPSTPNEIVVVVALALICSAYGFITQTLVQPHVPAETTGFAFSLEPVCSAAFSFFLVGEVLSPIAFFGAASSSPASWWQPSSFRAFTHMGTLAWQGRPSTSRRPHFSCSRVIKVSGRLYNRCQQSIYPKGVPWTLQLATAT